MKQVFLIKLSGEAMSGVRGFGLDFGCIEKICRKIKFLSYRATNRFYQLSAFLYNVFCI